MSLPVLYLHAKGRGAAGASEIGPLMALGTDICSRLGGKGVTRTDHGYDQPVALLGELVERFPGQPIAFVQAGLNPTRELMASLVAILDRDDSVQALSMLSNACPQLNPFARLDATGMTEPDNPGDLVSLLAEGGLHPFEQWPDHFVLISADAARRMAAASGTSTLQQCLVAIGGRLAVPDIFFLQDDGASLFAAHELEPHESLYPPAFGKLSARLHDWLKSGGERKDGIPISQRAATLHITHSWGGGIAHWIRSYVSSDPDNTHYQLRAEGPQADRGCGQRLALYAGNELDCPIASWWLQPPIVSVVDTDAEYQRLLGLICRRYGIGRIIVSSLIGHSLDAYRSGLPTLQVLHDNFPLWPLLSVHPAPFLRENEPADIAAALAARPHKIEFNDKDASGWSAIREAYLQALTENRVQIVAPGQAVLQMHKRLAPNFDESAARVIPHGHELAGQGGPIEPRPREDGRLRMAILGRIQSGKGQQLLRDSLEQLLPHVQVYLLGAGRSADRLFGHSGANVVIEYEPEELPGLLRDIGPHFAALLSIVPETFSYTLSELRMLGIPAIATRVGSFPDRIEHGRNGWLIEPEPTALVGQVAELCGDPAEIERVRTVLADAREQTLEEMVAAYREFFPLPDPRDDYAPTQPGIEQVQAATAAYQGVLTEDALEQLEEEFHALRQELEERTEKLSREIEDRTRWARDTIAQLETEQQARRHVEQALNAVRASLEELNASYQRLTGQYDHLAAQHAQVLGSRSWKLTRPLRVISRLGGNFARARAWNPLRWPGLLATFGTNISRLGLMGALIYMQASEEERQKALSPPVTEETGTAQEPVDSEPPGAFPEVESPDVSIVMPVFNNWRYTAACLRSLADHPGERSFEMIIVDDCSSDETQSLLSAIRGLTCLRNEENLGFVGSCNRGAEQARGEYLVFLNNDTQVTPGWLDALIDTLESEPGAGLVGARLVYPNGRLQESGGMIFDDGSGWNYGREDDPEKADYSFLREADYCSGACIALRTDLFRQLGAFDERYAPAYYEDTDLAFRVRESGLKVFVQPASTVIHYEGITSGTDTTSGMKRYQVVNQEKFVERWRNELLSQPECVNDKTDRVALRAATRHRDKGSVLLVEEQGVSEPQQLEALLTAGRRSGYGITLLTLVEREQEFADRLQGLGIEIVVNPGTGALPEFFSERGEAFDHVFYVDSEASGMIPALIDRYCPSGRAIVIRANDFERLRELLS